MEKLQKENFKLKVHDYWNQQACGTQASNSIKFTKDYFEDIEAYRYSIEPEIFSFAQFTRFHDKKVLEVGTGTGTDFLQWVRAGAETYGIDLTTEGVEHVKHRLHVYGLKAKEVRVADCEALPYGEDTFDLVYSWGVIHHTQDTQKALEEIIRVCRPGGMCKIMLYHRHSLVSYYTWIKHALFKFRPYKSLSWCLYHYMESVGTKAFTPKEVVYMLKNYPVENIKITPRLTYYDKLGKSNKLFQKIANILATILGGDRVGWFLLVEFSKINFKI